jgi:hypothetical protein
MATLFYGTSGFETGKGEVKFRDAGYGFGPTRQSRRAAKAAANRRQMPERVEYQLPEGPRVDYQMPKGDR